MYYAEINRYGLGTTTTAHRGGKEIIVSAGTLYRFETRQQREDWLLISGNRRTLTARNARSFYSTGDLKTALWFSIDHDWGDQFIGRDR